MSDKRPQKSDECRHPEGRDAYHRVTFNVDHATKQGFEVMRDVYLAEFGDMCTATQMMILDNRSGYRARKQAEAAAKVQAAFPGAEVSE